MEDLKELYDYNGQLVKRMNDMSERVADEGRSFTQEELEEFDKAAAEQAKVKEKINTVERVQRAKSLTNKSEVVQRENNSSNSYGGITGKDVDNSFRAWSLRKLGQPVSDHLRRSADRCGVDITDDNFIMRQQSLSNSEGGYTKDSNIFQGLIEAKAAYGGMASLCTKLVTNTGESIAWAYSNDTGNSGGWGSELTAITNTSATFSQVSLSAYLNVSGVFPVSLRLLQDSHAPIESFIGKALGKRLARNEATALVAGDGSSKPTGIKNASAGKTAASTSTFTLAELQDLYLSVDSEYRSNSSWLMSSESLGILMSMVDDIGRPLLMPDYNSSGSVGRLFGRPVVIDEACPAIGASAKPVFFGDFSAYLYRRVGNAPVIGVDKSKYFLEMGLAYIAWDLVDGKLLDSRAVKALAMAAS